MFFNFNKIRTFDHSSFTLTKTIHKIWLNNLIIVDFDILLNY